jgi:hypothetical protein
MTVGPALSADRVTNMHAPESHPEVAGPVRDAGPLEGNVLSGAFAGMLASFGVVSAPQRDAVADVVAAELASRGHSAQILKLRYSTLHLEADAQSARFLRYDVPALLVSLAQSVPGQVERIVVRVGR